MRKAERSEREEVPAEDKGEENTAPERWLCEMIKEWLES